MRRWLQQHAINKQCIRCSASRSSFHNWVVSAEHRLYHAGSQLLIFLKVTSASQELHIWVQLTTPQRVQRMVLLTTASIFDLLGLPSPVVIDHNIYLQKLCKTNYTGMNYFHLICNKNGISCLRLFLIVTFKDNQEGYLLQCYPTSSTWILR